MSKLGLQLIVFGGKQNEDFPGVLAQVKEVGYDGVETGVMYPTMGADTVLSSLKDSGLALTGIHTGYADISDEARVRDHIGFLKQAGSRFLICSGVADNNSIAGFEQSADTFNRAGEMCAEAGLTFCYHNHAWEFKPLEGGKQGIYTLIERTDPALVKLNIDVYWVYIGGADPVDFIATYSDRAGYYHFKDGTKVEEGFHFVELGQGDVDLVAAKDEVMRHPLDWIICEQDRTTKTPEESIKESFDYLKDIGL